MNRWSQSRRTLLKSMGAGSALLPLVGSGSARAQAKPPVRLIIVIQTNGVPGGSFDKVASTTNFASSTVPEVLTPLKDFYQDLIVLPHLSNPQYEGAGHGAFGTTFSPGPNTRQPEYWVPAAATLDQICAAAVAKTAPSLPMASLPLQVFPDTSESRLGAFRCFFKGSNQPITPLSSPYKVAEQLFAGKMMGPDPALEKLAAERRSMLDFVKGDLQRFSTNLGKDDQMSVSSHLQSIREIEMQLAGGGGGAVGAGCTTPNLGTPVDLKAAASLPTLMKLNFDMAALALSCDSTRVVTVTTATAFGDNQTFPWLGIQGAGQEFPVRHWHDIAHRETNGSTNDKLNVDKWFMTQFAYLLKQLKNTPEGNGNMLDNTIVLWGNHMQDGGHDAGRLPWILAGKGGGYFKTNQLLKPAQQISKVQVMCEIANAMGANVPFLGDASYGGPLPLLRA